MENNVQIFNNEEFGKIRIVNVNNEPWFVGRDVAEALGYSNASKAVMTHVDDEDKTFSMVDIADSQNGNVSVGQTKTALINESGLYSLVMSSKLESAKKFKKWVTSEVLPTIRKTTEKLQYIEYSGAIDGLVYTKNGVPTTTSVMIAKKFGRDHKNVLQMIDNKINSKDKTTAEFSAEHIKETKYLFEDGRELRQYELDKQGFSFIALSMTGTKADIFKIQYINAFTKMEEAIANMYKARVIEDVLPQDNSSRQFVYVLKNPLNETVKIGVAQDVKKRIAQLQTGAGVELELVYQSMICSNAFSIERDVHSHFEQYRTFGEWFKVSPKEVIDYLDNQKYVLKSEYTKYLSFIDKNTFTVD